MKKETTYAMSDDVVSAIELLNEGSETNVKSNLGIYNTISAVNMGVIKESDCVLVMSREVETITWVVSYLYTPEKLVIKKVRVAEETSCWITKFELIQREMNQLLTGYICTEAIGLSSKIKTRRFGCHSYDVIIADISAPMKTNEDRVINRFDIETGEEYEMYEEKITLISKIIKKDGRVVLLCKPSWILKSWKLLQELGLEIECQEYSLYIDNIKHPNALLWLRLVKVEGGFNVDKQKRNILSLMKDNNIDRLYAHRNNLVFPYVELSYKKTDSYVQLDQDLQHMQYFFSLRTTQELAKLCVGYTACLVTPSIAKYAYEHNRNIVLFERDNRFRRKKDLRFVKYDLNTGLTKFTQRKYANKFDVVICDPPFNIRLDTLAKDIAELLKHDGSSTAYIVFPERNSSNLINAMIALGLSLEDDKNNIEIEYSRPPKLVRVKGRKAIQLYKFIYSKQ